MHELTEELRLLVAATYARLRPLSEAEADRPLAPGKWTKKEVVGHLIDSAANNHQRFVRGQLSQSREFAGYEQAAWVDCQRYGLESWGELLDLWRAYNLHLRHVIASIPEGRLDNLCSVDGGEPVTLRFLAEDYVTHLRHHLAQLHELGPEARA